MSFNVTNPIIGLKNQLFTGNGTFLVPQNVYTIWVDATSSGAGGGGGFNGASGGGGGGGASGQMCKFLSMPVSPGETLTIVIGAQTASSTVGSIGAYTNTTSIAGTLDGIYLGAGGGGGYGFAGTVTNGGGYYSWGSPTAGPTGAGNNGTFINPSTATNAYINRQIGSISIVAMNGATGGGPSASGGATPSGGWSGGAQQYSAGGTALTTQGGGGSGGHSFWGTGAPGGNGNVAGGDATGYGAGGAGGGAGAGGGKGSQGFARIYWQG